jgi:hypothetical protein
MLLQVSLPVLHGVCASKSTAAEASSCWLASTPLLPCSRLLNNSLLHCRTLLQVSLLVLHESFSPATPRLLRQAAELLCPQSVAVGTPLLAEHITPITTGSGFEGAEEAAVKPVFASILHLANAGESRKDALQLAASCSFVQIRHQVCP